MGYVYGRDSHVCKRHKVLTIRTRLLSPNHSKAVKTVRRPPVAKLPLSGHLSHPQHHHHHTLESAHHHVDCASSCAGHT